MLRYIVRRLFIAVPTLWVIITLSFLLMKMAPGGPFDSERPLSPTVIENLNKAYHLDRPLIIQYGIYIKNLLLGDLGPSLKRPDFTVNQLIWNGFPVSFRIGIWAMVLALGLGVSFGAWAALRQNTAVDYGVMGVAMVGITVPNFVVAPLLTLVLGVYWGWLPVAGWNNGAWQNMILPVFTLGLPQIAYISRLTRGSMIEVLRTHFIRTAKAKGMPPRVILLRHALKPAMLPIISYVGPALAGIITGSFVIESIFGLPGIGQTFVGGAINRDYTLVMGVVIFYGALIVVVNLIVDVLYGALDPRIKYTKH